MHSVAEYDQRSVEAFASLKLTPREAEVLFWISQSKSNHDISVILGAKTGTICKHAEHILSKLNVEIARPPQWWRSKRATSVQRHQLLNLIDPGPQFVA